MSLILLDTAVLVHLARNSDLGKKILADEALLTRPEKPLISVITVGEGLAFAEKDSWGNGKRDRLLELFSQLVVVDINSTNVLEQYARTQTKCKKEGWGVGQNDVWIAATAVATESVLFTADTDFDPLVSTGILKRKLWSPQAPYASRTN